MDCADYSLGSTAGELDVMPKLNGQDAAANAAKVTVVADALSSNQSKVSVAEDHVKAGESTTVTLIAKDAHGNAISGLVPETFPQQTLVGKPDGCCV